MAKKDKSKKSSNPQQAVGGYLYSQQAETAFMNFLTRMPDLDEVLRKAGVSRHRLSVLMYDDEIYQCVEKRQDKALLNSHASSVMSINSDESVEAINSSQNGSTAFESFDKKIERSIQKIVLGQTLTSGTDNSGSRALGEIHLEVQNNKIDADIRMITPTIQAMLDALCALNGWERHLIVIGDEKSLNAPKADRDVKLKNAGANLSQQYFLREYGLQEGDVTEIQQVALNNQFNALPHKAFSFAASIKKLSAEQQEVEELTDGQDDLQLLTNEQIRQLAADSETPEALLFNLSRLIPGATQSQFTANLDQALFAADVLGYATAAKGK